MFWFLIDVLALRRLGLARPFRYLLLFLFGICFIAGLVYAAVVLRAVAQRNEAPHVRSHHSR